MRVERRQFGIKKTAFFIRRKGQVSMKIAIIDDDKQWRNTIKENVKKYYQDQVEIDLYAYASDFLSVTKKYDILFMDLEFENEKETGFELTQIYKTMYREAIVIILTTHTELARKGYQVNAFRYIDKMHLEEMTEALKSADKVLLQEKRIAFHFVSEGEQKIKCRELLYIEARGRKVEVVTTQGTFLCNEKMEELEKRICKYGFYRIHRAYLVNMQHVIRYNKKEIVLSQGQMLCISRRRYDDFRNTLFEWKMERANG